MTTPAPVPTVLDNLDSDEALSRIRHYFGACKGAPAHAGAQFTTLGHPWDAKKTATTITPADLLALSTLQAPIRGEAAVWILRPKHLKKAKKQLAKIPVDAKLTDKQARKLLSAKGPVAKLEALWSKAPGMGPVTVSKLLARKRSKLVPSFETSVASELGITSVDEQWDTLLEIFVKDPHGLWEAGKSLRKRAGLDASVTPLRVLDALQWHRVNYPDWDGCPSTED
ncbi:DUF6308 family protein [Demequina flava]|uniref:DUF6308 family protein n=1 Tax=Demequina flava TaxID=1095025 RepID=UPI000780E88B|nr:DUF6308 family protein [Demequina flava]